PMTAILGYADLMAGANEPPIQRNEYLTTVRRNGEHLLAVINDILDISKIEAGRLTVESVACSPAEIVCEVVSLMRPRAAAKGLNLRVSFDSLIPQTIRSDPTRLRQILLNLLSNAIKFTDSGHVLVNIKLLGEEKKIAFTVSDTGIGMTEEQRQ